MQLRVGKPIRWGTLAALAVLSVHETGQGEVAFPYAVVTSPSATGSFGLYLGNLGANQCRELVGQLGLESGQPLRVRQLSDCEFAVAPLIPLPVGRHCLRPLLGPESAPCIDVTGRSADPSEGTVSLQLNEGTGQTSKCYACGDRGEAACTRQKRILLLDVKLTGVREEVPAGSLFAVNFSAHRPDIDAQPPETHEFRLLSRIEEDSYQVWPPPGDGEETCVTLYAQPFEGGAPTRIGSACVGPAGPREGPTRYEAYRRCLLSHWQQWCADNQADCRGAYGARIWACGTYESTCAKEPDPALLDASEPSLPAASPAAGAVDAGADATAAETTDAAANPSAPRTSYGSAGCSLGGASSGTTFTLLLALSSLLLVRRRSLPRT